ncbi:hypothetical protein Sant_3116 [Sodalis praecaptivus]|uniref:Alginate lyase domain-containing protein n=1 Tax=Sodalis praecaptivus TaxID=1239307 RepID=K7TG72_9GAMM|nr:alginate lyase family protein [Sodalis praecaptivus]AFW03770.1 hypothetical protein [Sodalis praecaptivus]AHF78122.1 hypothetical protein Sant_3116 [Sodalis praecaptivus]
MMIRYRLCRGILTAAALVAALAGYAAQPTPLASSALQRQTSSLHHAVLYARHHEPQPIPRLHTEGTLPHHGIYDQSVQAKKDLPLMLKNALAWQAGIDGEEGLRQARRYVLAWVTTWQPTANPIDETQCGQLVETWQRIRSQVPASERQTVDRFLTRWADSYLRRIAQANQAMIWRNNWQSHRIKLLTLIAVATDNARLFDQSRALFRQQIARNMTKTGVTVDYEDRDALHYVVYDLQPLVDAALAARGQGEDWYHWRADNGASLAQAIHWLLPYVNGEKTHPEFVHSRVKFDRTRANAGIKGFTGNFDARNASDLLWSATLFDRTLGPVAKALSPQPPLSVAGAFSLHGTPLL